MNTKNYTAIHGTLQKKRERYQPIAIGDIRTVSNEEWAKHWRPHGPGWRDPRPDNIRYLARAYGGSDMGALMGVSHFKSRLELFHQKSGFSNAIEREGNTDAKELGHLYETPTALKYHILRRRAGAKVTLYIEGRVYLPDGSVKKNKDGSIFDEPLSMQIYRDGRKDAKASNPLKLLYPWALANCDGFLFEDGMEGILEIKTTSPRNFSVIEDWENGVIPMAYYYQIVYYMAILNVMYCDIFCSWDQTLEGCAMIRVYRDYEVEEKLFRTIEEFDDYVEQMIEPDPSFDDPDLLLSHYYELFGPVQEDAPMVELPEKYRPLVNRAINLDSNITAAKKQLEELEKQQAAIYAELYPIYRNSSYGQFQLDDTHTVSITLKTPMKRARIDEERFKKDHPDIYEECRIFSSTELGNANKKLKKKYMLPAEPNTEDKSKLPSFALKVKEVKK